ncbi:hypothetical protein [Xenorhabdus bovienii]|uniref:hypothetical protein n=1 Tax=Xenorhabdus bovienii TaxID=40576 RepID=UPI0023B33232|nr:hypothetical protein [Xenorhabdus bovienii]MDE9454535.1 hypothetical protein [Xenorhabdus bovienii]
MGVYLQIFEAYFIAGSSKVTDRLYANGNQQVKVAINIKKTSGWFGYAFNP